MMKLFFIDCTKSMWSRILLLSVVLCLCISGVSFSEQAAEESKPTVAKDAVAPSTVVARMGDYTITREELEQRVMRELYPNDYDTTGEDIEPVCPERVLKKMLVEKAMIIEGRQKNFLNDEQTRTSIRQQMERRIVNLLFQKHIEANEDKTTPSEDEIKQKLLVDRAKLKQKMQADPNFVMPDPNTLREKAISTIRRVKQTRIIRRYCDEIYKKSNVKKLKENFPKVIAIHQRLMTRPKQPRKVNFIRNWQVRDELTQSEKDMVLVQFDGGKVTLYDWFNTLCNIVPPRRPRNLNTVAGVERMLDRAISGPLLVHEAQSLGLDKDEEFMKQMREYEDRRLLGQVRSAKMKENKEPTDEEIIAYYNENKDAFITGRNIKIDTIWCENLDEAKKVKAELDAGKDFEAVKKQFTPDDERKPFSAYPGSEGLFWKDIKVGEPNDVIGPLKGFHRQKIQWRVVKILENNPGKPREYTDNMKGQIKSQITTGRNEALMEQYGKELLAKHAHEIYADKFKDFDPLDIP